MKILGIETSCDETAAAVVEDGTKVLSNVVASSQEMHARSGGIIPEQAARQQVKSIIPVVSQALITAFENSKQKYAPAANYLPRGKAGQLLATNLDAIAVTVGPGLIGSLLVGVETAKTLSYLWEKPLVPVNHLIGHIYANFIRENSKLPELPALALVVSGGHTDLVLMNDHGNIKWLGGTRDDAAGEAFDKTARLLGLPYPGGPSIANEAMKLKTKNEKLIMFPRPMLDDISFDWSFSGLKTAVLNEISNRQINQLTKRQLAAEIQEAIVDSLVVKSSRAIKSYKPKTFLLAGGVAANKRLREKFKLEIEKCKLKINFMAPEVKYCTDNASYIAACAYYNYKPVDWKKINVNPNLAIVDRT